MPSPITASAMATQRANVASMLQTPSPECPHCAPARNRVHDDEHHAAGYITKTVKSRQPQDRGQYQNGCTSWPRANGHGCTAWSQAGALCGHSGKGACSMLTTSVRCVSIAEVRGGTPSPPDRYKTQDDNWHDSTYTTHRTTRQARCPATRVHPPSVRAEQQV